jgi:hypothetical protein
VRLNTGIFPLACLLAFTLFATSSEAQNASIQLPSEAYGAKAATGEGLPVVKTQERPKSEGVSADVTDTCTYTFTSGSGTTFLKFCVTVNGNIVQFQSPAGVEQIFQGGTGLEGYGICDATNANTQYYDYADMASGNWNNPTTVTHTSEEVKIERTQYNGGWDRQRFERYSIPRRNLLRQRLVGRNKRGYYSLPTRLG